MYPQLAQIASLISAQTPDPKGCAGGSNMLLPVLLIGIFYFIMIRPAQKDRQRQQKLWDGLKRGDEVITTTGLVGAVADVSKDSNLISLEIAKNVKVRLLKSAIAKRMEQESDSSSDDGDKGKSKS